MANSKKLDPNKLLGPKKEFIKDNKSSSELETVVKQIHENKSPQEETKRSTIDIPESLHKKIKMKLVDKEQTIRDYFLELARKDLGLQ